ncbi:MAG: hypothetical protein J6A49_04960 [Clostridia bacterium]|nr:hypothetical protein [Clostridia bacterium]
MVNEKMSFIIVLVGVSGSGKSTLKKHAIEKISDISNMIAVTNRMARTTEQNGIDKLFYSNYEFNKAVLSGELCLINKVYGNMYAFRVSDFISGGTYLTELHYKNYNDFINYNSNTVNIYIRPSNIIFAQTGIYSRGATQKEIDSRINSLQQEHNTLEQLAKNGFFDYTFINDYTDTSVQEFIELIKDIIDNRSNIYENKKSTTAYNNQS